MKRENSIITLTDADLEKYDALIAKTTTDEAPIKFKHEEELDINLNLDPVHSKSPPHQSKSSSKNNDELNTKDDTICITDDDVEDVAKKLADDVLEFEKLFNDAEKNDENILSEESKFAKDSSNISKETSEDLIEEIFDVEEIIPEVEEQLSKVFNDIITDVVEKSFEIEEKTTKSKDSISETKKDADLEVETANITELDVSEKLNSSIVVLDDEDDIHNSSVS